MTCVRKYKIRKNGERVLVKQWCYEKFRLPLESGAEESVEAKPMIGYQLPKTAPDAIVTL